ncbi:MAG: alpha-N-acetylglucosaminidase [Bacteroidaceae bacterium]|nr:alpha-N-acetylglucosaminidase [Bacteroidaceae bacterium]
MKRIALFLFILVCQFSIINLSAVTPIDGLLERIDRGASKKFIIQQVKSDVDFFELDQKGSKPVIRGNSWVNIATGLNWYLKHHAGIHLTWNQMQAKLPAQLPAVMQKERHETNLRLRYDFNYCTFSYSMAFWDWKRWQTELDWMALHGINMPLAAVGHECVWRNMLLRMGYSEQDVANFIPGPAFLAWWEMNNLEGWGGPLPLSWYGQQEKLQKRILKRMKEYGMKPVLPGYCGMIPSFLSDGPKQQWNGFTRPSILLPNDPRFAQYAKMFYEETKRLYGEAEYYSMDPFHEGSLPQGVNIGEMGRYILSAMKQAAPQAKWVVQGWNENPRPKMLEALPAGEVIVLDLFSECSPMWGIPSRFKRENGYGDHDWIFCMLENFGANVGLHGRMDLLLNNFRLTRTSPLARHIVGWGLTMEGSENNPAMFELMSELPWLKEIPTKEAWLDSYVKARYGKADETIRKAWQIIADGIYNAPFGNYQQGPHESIFCARPAFNCFQVSSWSKMNNYYDPTTTWEAAQLMLSVAEQYRGNNNFEYDLVDICRQALADKGRIVYNRTIADFNSCDKRAFKQDSEEFLRLLLQQDSLLATRSEFRLGNWTQQARQLGTTLEECNQYEWNARVQITTWGNRHCADEGKLRDYAHKEWQGILRDFYYPRWKHFFGILQDELDGRLPMMAVGNSYVPKEGNPAVEVDWYGMEEPWTLEHNAYLAQPEGNPIDVARKVIKD